MRPSFLRFPAGNYLECGRIEPRFDWKKMIGPLVDGPTHPTTWSYHSSDGMGLLEFLLWYEDLRMEPVLGVYAGYSLGEQVVKPGPTSTPTCRMRSTRWSMLPAEPARRGRCAHAMGTTPLRSKLRYVEVGNEDSFDHARRRKTGPQKRG
jgi:alpha-N-arabinofuranosidase